MNDMNNITGCLSVRDARRLDRPSVAERIEADELLERLAVRCDDADAIADALGGGLAA